MDRQKTLDCFVIMPFSKTTPEHTEQYWNDHYEQFLKPVIEQIEGINVYRSTPIRGDLIRNIITSLVKADIVLADLTDKNPNVYWELGVRQSFKHGTIVILEEGQKPPFDVSPKAYHKYYPKDHVKNERFKSNITNAINDFIEYPRKADSHVLETLDGRGTIYEIVNNEDKYRKLIALRNEIEANKEYYNAIKGILENNFVQNQERYPLVSIITKAVELLYVSRYFEEDEINYTNLESYYIISNQIEFYTDKMRLDPGSKFNLGFQTYLSDMNDPFLTISENLLDDLYKTEMKIRSYRFN